MIRIERKQQLRLQNQMSPPIPSGKALGNYFALPAMQWNGFSAAIGTAPATPPSSRFKKNVSRMSGECLGWGNRGISGNDFYYP